MKEGLHWIRCRDASELLSLGRDGRLSASQRISVGMHLAVCVHCRRFGKQLKLLGRAFRETGDRDGA